MERVLKEFLSVNKITIENANIIVAVSTGADSMALLLSLIKLKEKINFNIIVAHVNHDKRKESLEEEEYITNFCKQYSIICEKIKLTKEDFKNSNFQNEARVKRYHFFKRILKKYNSYYLFLAHHAIDNMETIFMRMIRGSNLKGYAGILPVAINDDYILLRPFLENTKEELINYLKVNNIKYYEDITNYEEDYMRNRIRKHVIPEILRESKDAYKKINEFSSTIYQAAVIVNNYRDFFINQHIKFADEKFSFSITEFLSLNEFMQIELLFELLKNHNLGKNNIYEIIKMINSEKANIKNIYKNKFTFVKEYDIITIYNKKISDEHFYLEINNIGDYHLNDIILISVVKKNIDFLTNLPHICYNMNKLPLIIRTRKNGDIIKLKTGSKKVKDLLIDKKIGILERNKVLVAENKNGEIISVIGIVNSCLLDYETDIAIIIKDKTGNENDEAIC